MSPRRTRAGDEKPETPRWWEDAEHFVVLHKEMRATGAAGTDENNPHDRAPLVYESGEEYPAEQVTPSMWSGTGDRLAALSQGGERLDTPSAAERSGHIDAEPALRAWRQENSLRRTTVKMFVCKECGEEFESRDELNGHQSAHTEGETDDAEGGAETETFAGELGANEGGEQA